MPLWVWGLACTALPSSTHSHPHSFLERRRARPARECRMREFTGHRWSSWFTTHNVFVHLFIRHLWQSTKHIKWSSKVVHKNNTIRAYNHSTYITRSYSASKVSCTHVLVEFLPTNFMYHTSGNTATGAYTWYCPSVNTYLNTEHDVTSKG